MVKSSLALAKCAGVVCFVFSCQGQVTQTLVLPPIDLGSSESAQINVSEPLLFILAGHL